MKRADEDRRRREKKHQRDPDTIFSADDAGRARRSASAVTTSATLCRMRNESKKLQPEQRAERSSDQSRSPARKADD